MRYTSFRENKKRKPCVRRNVCPQLAAPIGNFMGAWKNCVLLQENFHAHQIPRFGGGLFWISFLGGEVPIYFYGREDFSDIYKVQLSQNAGRVVWKGSFRGS